jgi:hypothetical protein
MTVRNRDGRQLIAACQALCERYRRASRAAGLLETLLPDAPEVTEVTVGRVPIEQRLNAMAHLAGEALEKEMRECTLMVHEFERSIEKLDRKFPMAWFRKYCQVTPETALGFADYAGLLSNHMGTGDDLRLDRIQLIITRLVEQLMPRSRTSVEQRLALVTEALPPSELDASVVETAVKTLRATVDRLNAFAHFEELLGSDLMLEARGFKLSLRAKLLHPAIMAAAIELNDSIDETIQRVARADMPEGADLQAYMAQADVRVREMFKRARVDETTTEKGFEGLQKRRAEWKRKKDEQEAAVARVERRKKEKEQWQEKKRGPVPYLVTIAVLGAILFLRLPHRPDTQPLSQAELGELSSVLASGAIGPVKHPVMLMGQVETAAWANLTPQAKHDAAVALASAMQGKGLSEATVLSDKRIAVQIRQNEVLIAR